MRRPMTGLCALPECRRPVGPDAVPVTVTVDGYPLVGVACTQPHADEVERRWRGGEPHFDHTITPGPSPSPVSAAAAIPWPVPAGL